MKRFIRTEWNAGVSKVDITPKEPIWLHGWSQAGPRAKPSKEVTQRIFVKSLALQDQTGQVSVWVTADLLGYSRDMAHALATRARKKFGLERSRLILNASHNHSGPATGDLLHLYYDLPKSQLDAIARYTEWLLDRIIESVGLAIADLAPAALAFGQGLSGFAVNRRRDRAAGRALPTVVDQDVPVLSVRSPEGTLRAIVFGYSCHATTVYGSTIHGDYPGYAQEYLEAMHPGTIALFVAGCCGDANPLPCYHDGLVEAYGRILSVAVHKVLSAEMQPVKGPLRTAFTNAMLPFQTPPTRKELRAMLPGRTGFQLREVRNLLSILDNNGALPTACEFPVQVWRFGSSLQLIALAGEPVADYSHRFKREYGYDNTWVSGYNDVLLAYIPSLRVWNEGGYEGFTGMMEYGLPGPFAPSVEEIIANTVAELLQQTSGAPRAFPRPSRFE